MSFFDDEPDEPTRVTRSARPRRAAAARGGGRAIADDAIRRRRLVAVAGAVVLVILLAFAVKGCLDSRKTRALKDYNRDVAAIVQSSDEQVSRQLFDVLDSGRNANELQTAVQQVRLAADENVASARGLDPRDEMKPAQRNLELVMNLRAAGVQEIAELIPAALGDRDPDEAIRKISGQMQAFLASDVVYSQRVAPLIRDALDDAGVSGQEIRTSKFLPSIGWLDPAQVATRLNPGASSASGSSSGAAAPGTHGHGLISTAVGGQTLVPGGQTNNRVPGGANPSFDVTIANQGENDEGPVTVQLKMSGGSTRDVTVNKRINQTKAGTNAQVNIPLGRRAPTGTAVTVTVSVRPVPGEQKTDNYTQSYLVLFTS